MKYFEACKIWNEKTKSSQWCIPKKGSKEYEEVIAIMKGTAKEEVKAVEVKPVPVEKKEIPKVIINAVETLKEVYNTHKTNPSPDTKTHQREDRTNRHAITYVTYKIIPETEKKLNKAREKLYNLLDKYDISEEEIQHLLVVKPKDEVKPVPVEKKKEVKNEIIQPKKENTIEELGIERNIKLDKLIQRTLNLWNNRNESIKLITDQKTTYDTATNKEKDDFINFIVPQQLRQLLPKHLQNITFDQLLPIFKKYVKNEIIQPKKEGVKNEIIVPKKQEPKEEPKTEKENKEVLQISKKEIKLIKETLADIAKKYNIQPHWLHGLISFQHSHRGETNQKRQNPYYVFSIPSGRLIKTSTDLPDEIKQKIQKLKLSYPVSIKEYDPASISIPKTREEKKQEKEQRQKEIREAIQKQKNEERLRKQSGDKYKQQIKMQDILAYAEFLNHESKDPKQWEMYVRLSKKDSDYNPKFIETYKYLNYDLEKLKSEFDLVESDKVNKLYLKLEKLKKQFDKSKPLMDHLKSIQ